jgi:transposase
VTRAYKRTLNRAQRKAFRSRMWEFRRRPEDLSQGQAAALEALFEELPLLGMIYHARWDLTRIFDEAPDRQTAAKRIEAWRQEMAEFELDWGRFLETYDRHREGILAYFDERQTSGPVEGLNNKARVVLKRCYGLKSVSSLWTRLILEINKVGDRVGHTIQALRELAHGIRREYCRTYT